MENAEKKLRVAFYLRVSTEEQKIGGYGLEMQKDALDEVYKYRSKSHGWIHEEDWEYQDVSTGSNLERDGYKALMEDVAKKKYDIVAVWKIDRISRNLGHLLQVFEILQKNNVSFYSHKENIDFSGPIGKLTFQIFGALAEFEREMIRARTSEGKLASARKGNYVKGNAPYGYTRVPNGEGEKGSKLIVNATEANIVRQVFNWFYYDRMNYLQIAKKLTVMKITKGQAVKNDKKTTCWYDSTIAGMLRKNIYIGIDTVEFKNHKGELEELIVKVPPIIDEVIFNNVQEMIKASDKEGNRVPGARKYLLTLKVIDMETGNYYYGYERGKGGNSYRRRAIKDKITGEIIHPNTEIPGDRLDEHVWNVILN